MKNYTTFMDLALQQHAATGTYHTTAISLHDGKETAAVLVGLPPKEVIKRFTAMPLPRLLITIEDRGNAVIARMTVHEKHSTEQHTRIIHDQPRQ